ncbi:MAG: helix-turn-helix domain-containing protein [Deltaproteobacteria bacterium]|jgi:transcriptional regulator with XRE-family HTH domain|nr:helix-turn-helix domain-containing protein [Deltaproteobacteria bacterium]
MKMKINGTAFVKARESHLLGVLELANKADVTFKTLSRVEKGQSVKQVSLRKVIKALGLTIEEAFAKRMVIMENDEKK